MSFEEKNKTDNNADKGAGNGTIGCFIFIAGIFVSIPLLILGYYYTSKGPELAISLFGYLKYVLALCIGGAIYSIRCGIKLNNEYKKTLPGYVPPEKSKGALRRERLLKKMGDRVYPVVEKLMPLIYSAIVIGVGASIRSLGYHYIPGGKPGSLSNVGIVTYEGIPGLLGGLIMWIGIVMLVAAIIQIIFEALK